MAQDVGMVWKCCGVILSRSRCATVRGFHCRSYSFHNKL